MACCSRVADRTTGQRTIEGYGVRDAIAVGAAQALALNPGTSRSGITITAGRFLGFDRDAAARISFLMMIPVTAGAVLFKMTGLATDGIPDDLVVPMIVGIVTSGLVGLARRVGHAAPGAHAQLHAVRDLPGGARRRRADRSSPPAGA